MSTSTFFIYNLIFESSSNFINFYKLFQLCFYIFSLKTPSKIEHKKEWNFYLSVKNECDALNFLKRKKKKS